MGLIADCERLFGSKSLYDVLQVEEDVSTDQLKKAYRKASLLLHPDKVDETKKEEATCKFQVLAKVHFILSDDEKRALYDESGIVDDENTLSGDDSDENLWANYWRTLFPKITPKEIDDYLAKYRGSEEERNDVKENYIKYKGDVNKMSPYIIGYQFEDEDRLFQIMKDMIKTKEVPSFPKFKDTMAKKGGRERKAKKEAAEVAGHDQESLFDALSKRARERESSFNNLISSLESKYGDKESSGRKRRK